METRANYLVIGVFVLGLVGLLLGFIYWIKNDASGPAGKNYFVIFDGSVQGLTEASPVLFNGIRFGAVQSIELVPEDTRKVRAVISVRSETPVRTNSRARISQQGLAGYIAMEITPGTPDAPLLEAKANEKFPVIYADAASGGMLSGVSDAAGQATTLLAHVNSVVSNNEDTLHHTLTNIEALTSSVAQHKEDIASVLSDLRTLSGRLNEIAVKFDGAMDRVAGTSPNDQTSVVSQVQQAVISFRQLADKLDKSLGDRSGELTSQAERSLREFELLMKDTRRLADSLDRVVQKIDRNPTGFLLGGQQSPKY